MKFTLLVTSFLFSATTAFAADNCTAGIAKTLSELAPTSGEVRVTGHYTKKSESGEYKACSLSVKLDGERLDPNFKPESFDPSYGDGGAFWPFGSYPTVEIPTNEYERLISYDCSADDKGFSIDYTNKSRSGWRKTSRYSLALDKNDDGSVSISLRAGHGSPRSNLVTCRGTLSEVLK